jgi:AraC-like DNA-binding protein
MRKPLVRALIGSGLLVLGILIGAVAARLPVFASSTGPQNRTLPQAGPGDYCHLYEQILANELHVSTSALEQANRDALQKTINQLAQDGQITAAEQSMLRGLVQKYGTDPCTSLASAGSDLANNPAVQQLLAQVHTVLVSAVAQSLNMSPATLESDLSQGKTIPQIAQEQHVPLSTVNAAYLNAAKSVLAQAVSAQVITQGQADLLSGLATIAVNNGYYPLLQPAR